MKITPSCIQNILNTAKIEEVIPDFIPLTKSGTSLRGKCPKCGREGKGKGLIVTPSKGIYKCFSCDFGGKSPVDFLIETQQMDYPRALKFLADKYNIILEKEKPLKGPQSKGGANKVTFRDVQLTLSGLSDEDQKAWHIVDQDTKVSVNTFEPGTRDIYGKLKDGDDLIIWYYDLYGKPVMFTKPKTSKQEQLYRIRWQYPEQNLDKHGRAMKYSSPYGSGSHLFIPEDIRRIYHERRQIKRLYIQEGEKKAIKACKHGIPSVGIMGIQNIGHNNVLPYEFNLIIKDCGVEEVVFILDSDWDHISHDLKPGSRVDQRPYSFYWAVRNFRDYFKTFINSGIYLEIYFGYIIENDQKEKGIDDLLAGSLKLKENELLEDINKAINEKDGESKGNKPKYVHLNKISNVPDLKLLEFWNLQSADAFAKKYYDFLQTLPEFTIGKHKWKFGDKAKLEPAQPLQEDEQYWEKIIKTDRKGSEYVQYHFRYMYAYNFLKRRGFGRITMADSKFFLSMIVDKVVHIVESWYIRDFVMEFTKEIADKSDMVEVMDMLYRGGKMYFGPDSLSNLDFFGKRGKLHFEYADKNYQYLFFNDKYWKITSEGIEEKPMSDLQHYVWKENVRDVNVSVIPNGLISVDKIDEAFLEKNNLDKQKFENLIGQFDVTLSEDAKESHFIQYLINTGEFFWQKFQDPETRKPVYDSRSIEERYETNLHFVSKMTAIGYMLHRYNDASCQKAVIAMDGKLSEVGESNGRTGKSLLGKFLKHIINVIIIGAKSKDLESDPFLWEEVSEKTDLIILDDCRANFEFDFLFPIITGQLTVNRKGMIKVTFPAYTPKLFVTTNHAVNGASDSYKDRQALIAFSDYYNAHYKPLDEFGTNFFDEWDEKQWNLTYNFAAYCLMLYFRAQKAGWGVGHSGLIMPPTERLEKRRLRQLIGENFLMWAGEYFTVEYDNVNSGTTNMNCKIPRAELYNNFLDKVKLEAKYMTPQRFRKKMIAWCDYMGLMFNPHIKDKYGKPGGNDKSGGVEYFIIANSHFSGYEI